MNLSIHIPYIAVIFTSTLHQVDDLYNEMNEILLKEAEKYDGFLGMDSARSELGISVSYWKNTDDIKEWRQHSEHKIAIQKGIEKWYDYYNVRICKVEREYDFSKK